MRVQHLTFTTIEIAALKEKLLAKRVIDEKGCWLWTGGKHESGCGYIDMGKSKPILRYVHRVAAMVFNDFDLNSDEIIRHKCHKSLCFKPEHLIPGTDKQNAEDRVARMKG